MLRYKGRKYVQAAGSRVLYHIGPRKPKPEIGYKNRGWKYRSRDLEELEPGWQRPWLIERVTKAVFLTTQPDRVWKHHSRQGNVYAFRVPEWVIKEAGGIHEFDMAPEILIPEHLWPHVEFLGKKYDQDTFDKIMQEKIRYRVRKKKIEVTDEDRKDLDHTLQQQQQRKKRERYR
jgi:hypothetical protein